MGIVLTLSSRVRLCHGHQLEKAGTIRIALEAMGVTALPETLQYLTAANEAKVAQIAVAVIVLQHPVPRLDAAPTRDPHRGMGLLQRPWPDIDVAQLGVFAVETK